MKVTIHRNEALKTLREAIAKSDGAGVLIDINTARALDQLAAVSSNDTATFETNTPFNEEDKP